MTPYEWTKDDVLFLIILILANAAVMYFMPATTDRPIIIYLVALVMGVVSTIAIAERFPH